MAFLLLAALYMPEQENASLRVSGGKKYHLAKSSKRQGACSGGNLPSSVLTVAAKICLLNHNPLARQSRLYRGDK
jgi:hypothetical protein